MRSLFVLLMVFLCRHVSAAEAEQRPVSPGFELAPAFHEQVCTFANPPGVRIHINAPHELPAEKPLRLIIYGLPNGNTIEQTIGKQMQPEDDWHFDIQHVGAQTRFLRKKLTNELIVVAYLENNLKSWPAWRKQNGDKLIPEIIEGIKGRFKGHDIKLVLTGHSGGGSFTFGYLNQVDAIPGSIDRIAFLDSNYAYDTALHKAKLVEWLRGSDQRRLVVLAYRDYVALLNGKTFVSAAGGTWGRSELMKKDLEEVFKFSSTVTEEWQNHSTLDGRIKLILRDNPEKKIWHTVQVERNGFIHAMLIGHAQENSGYTYFGARVHRVYSAEVSAFCREIVLHTQTARLFYIRSI